MVSCALGIGASSMGFQLWANYDHSKWATGPRIIREGTPKVLIPRPLGRFLVYPLVSEQRV